MPKLDITAVIITDGEGYFIHGTYGETTMEMFKKMSGIWHFDPAHECAHVVHLEVEVPEHRKFDNTLAAVTDTDFDDD